MMKNKQMSSKHVTFAKGGNGHMFGKQTVKKQTPGVSAVAGEPVGKHIAGGSTKMFGKQTSQPAKAR